MKQQKPSKGRVIRVDGAKFRSAPEKTNGSPSKDRPAPELKGNDRFFNRELSLLRFNERVLELALDRELPLLERMRFLTISTSNLDEYFEIRVAGLKQQMVLEMSLPTADRLLPTEVFQQLSEAAHDLMDRQYRLLNEELLPSLASQGVQILKRGSWSPSQGEWIERYFRKEVLPVLAPVGLDPAHPFPRIVNKSLNFIVSLKGRDAFGRSSRAAVVQAPRLLPRLIKLPPEVAEHPHEFVMLSSVIHAHVGELFPGMKVRGCSQFRVTRNSDLWVDEEEVEDLLKALKGELLSRRFGGAVRLEVADNISDEMQRFLLDQFGLEEADLYRVSGPVNLHRLSSLYDLVDDPRLKYPAFLPGTPEQLEPGEDLFEVIREGDVLLHHPYQSFAPVVQLLRDAANDPAVMAIWMTVYRTGTDSPIVNALLEAARAGKEVTAVVELRARFDEAANIHLATKLQEAGAKVVYGVVGYKAHAKMLLIVRREGRRLRRYVHLGTGNYHTGTTKAYTDMGLMTCQPEVGQDVHVLFQQLTGLGRASNLKLLVQAPFTLHTKVLDLIRTETANARDGKPARIVAKMNSLIDQEVIEALYEASQEGVEVDLIVRGVCCLRPGVPGLSENVRVRSVMGRFLEHTRLFLFEARGKQKLLASSADWMPRNFYRRVETAFPILEPRLKKRVVEEGLLPYLADNTNSWHLQPDGSYERHKTAAGKKAFSAQEHLLSLLAQLADERRTRPR